MFLCYSVLKCVVELSRDTVDLQRPIFWDFFYSHVKPSFARNNVRKISKQARVIYSNVFSTKV